MEEIQSDGTDFFGFLTVCFIGLKLAGYINWSWWWIFAPMWIPLGLIVLVLFIAFLVNRK